MNGKIQITDRCTIRSAYESDAPAIADLILLTSLACCFNSASPFPDWYEATVTRTQILSLLQNEEMTWALAIQENKLAGVLAIQACSHVKYFFVHPDHHRQGIGKNLWAFALRANALGESISVRSSLFAVPVYERLGFTAIEPQQEFKGMHFQVMTAQLEELRRRSFLS